VQKVAVIGLGRFGMALARQLGASGVQVIALDRSPHLVAEVKDHVDLAVRLDSTDRQALLSQEVDKVDVGVVAIGENFEAALLTTALLKQLGVPEVICRAQTEVHARIFQQIGADRVIQPERETGAQLARQLANPHLVDFIRLADGFTLIEIDTPRAFHGKSIRDLGLRAKYDVNLVVLRRAIPGVTDEQAKPLVRVIVPTPDEVIQPDDVLVVVGPDEALARLPKE
jgi:trk system potassium uptake protein TrkA